MNLFNIEQEGILVKKDLLRLSTPLGTLVFNVKWDNNSLLDIEPNKTISVKNTTLISLWKLEKFQIEFLRLDIIPVLPPHMHVNHCICAMWRIKTFSPITVIFDCAFERKINNMEGSPETGEGLFAQTWEHLDTMLTIGTEDEEFLIQRDQLPAHFKNKISPDSLNFLENGIQVSLPEFQNNDFGQIHFVVSWKHHAEDDVSTWYAVDRSPTEILKYAGVQ